MNCPGGGELFGGMLVEGGAWQPRCFSKGIHDVGMGFELVAVVFLERKFEMKNCFGKIRGFFHSEKGSMALEWTAMAAGLVVAAIVIGVLVLDEAANEVNQLADNVQANGVAAVKSATKFSPYSTNLK